MKKWIGAVVLLGLIAAGVYLFLRFFRSAYPETVFPENTTLYFFVPDTEMAKKRLADTLFWKQIHNSPRKEIYERQLDRLSGFAETLTGVDLQPLFHEFTRDVAVGVFPAKEGSSGALLAYVDRESETRKIFEEKIDPALKRRIPDLAKSQTAYRDVSYYKYSSNRFPPRASPCYAFVDHHLLLSYSDEGIRSLLDVRSKNLPALKKSDLFRNAKKQTGYKLGLWFYVNVQNALKMVEISRPSALAKAWPSLVRIAGIDRLQSLSYTGTVQNDGFVEDGFVAMAPERKGLLKIYFDQKPQKLAAIHAVPPDAKVFSAGTLADFAKMWDEVNAQLSTILTSDEYDKWQKVLTAMRGIFNFDIRRDLLEPLGNEFSFSYEAADKSFSDPSKMKYLLTLHLRKPDQFRETLDRFVSLAALRGLDQKKEDYKGKKVQIFNISVGQFSAAPAYYVEDSWAYFSTEYGFLKKSIDAQESKRGIESLADYQKVTAGFPDEVNGISYTNVQAYLQMYGAILNRQADEPDNRWIRELGMQEEFASLGKNLYGSATYTQVTKDGMRLHSYSSVPTTFLSLPAIVTALPRLLREYKSREEW